MRIDFFFSFFLSWQRLEKLYFWWLLSLFLILPWNVWSKHPISPVPLPVFLIKILLLVFHESIIEKGKCCFYLSYCNLLQFENWINFFFFFTMELWLLSIKAQIWQIALFIYFFLFCFWLCFKPMFLVWFHWWTKITHFDVEIQLWFCQLNIQISFYFAADMKADSHDNKWLAVFEQIKW